MQHFTARLRGRALLVLLVVSVACSCRKSATSGAVAQMAQIVSVAAEQHLHDWPPDARESLVAAARSVVEYHAANGTLTDQSLASLEESLAAYLATFPRWQFMDPGRLKLRQASLAWRLDTFLSTGPPSPEQEAEISSQLAAAYDVALEWTKAACADLPENVRKEALSSLRQELDSAQGNVLTVQFLRALDSKVHECVLAEYRVYLSRVNVRHLAAPVDVFPRPQEVQQRQERDLAKVLYSKLSYYFQLRKEYGEKSPAGVADLAQERRNAINRRNTALREAADYERAVRRARRDAADTLQSYECVLLLVHAMEAIAGKMPLCPDGIADAVLPGENRAARALVSPVALVYRLETSAAGYASPYPLVDGSMTVLMVVDSGTIRAEVFSREPNWQSRGLLYEPVGTSVLRTDNRYEVYCPGVGQNLGVVSIREARTPSEPLSPLLSRDDAVERVLANCVAFRSIEAASALPVTPKSPDGLRGTVRWKPPLPYFYGVRLARGSYHAPPAESSAPRLSNVDLYAEQDDTQPSAVVVVSANPGGPQPALTVRIDVREGALRAPGATPPVTIADLRSIQYDLQRLPGKLEGMVVRSGSIRDIGGTQVASLSLQDVVTMKSLPVDFTSIRKALPRLCGTDSEWAYYSMRKALYLVREMEPASRSSFLAGVIDNCGKMSKRLRTEPSQPDSQLLAIEQLAIEANKLAGNGAAALEARAHYLQSVARHADERQWQLEIGWAISHCMAEKNRRFLDEFAALHGRHIADRMTSREAYTLAALSRGSGQWVYVVNFLSHARKEASEAAGRNTITLELASAWAELSKDLQRNRKWSPENTKEYADNARRELDAFQNSASAEEKSKHAELVKAIETALAGRR